MIKTTRTVIGLALAAAMFASQATAGEPKTVLELFTSQGCSSCPPADEILGELADREDVLALSLNVDYWDYLGWKDTLASSDNSDRQRAYSVARGDRQVYTPQIVVNGSQHIVGSNRSAVDHAIESNEGLPVKMDLSETGDTLTVKIDAGDVDVDRAMLWVVFYEREVSVPIERGENTGRTVTYSNVVKKLRPIAMWDGGEMTVDLPKSEMAKAGAKRCAVILQTETENGLPGQVLGAAMLGHDV